MISDPTKSLVVLLLASGIALADSAPNEPPKPAADAPQEEKERKAAAGSAETARTALPVYRLPPVGKPRRRIGGGRRGAPEPLPQARAIAPEHVGRTISEQPTLYWYLSDDPPPGLGMRVTVTDPSSIDPLLEAELSGPLEPGLHRLDLSRFEQPLTIGREYLWTISAQRSDDSAQQVLAMGWIERVAPPARLEERLANVPPERAAFVYADAALWYDAIDACAGRQDELGALLEQVGLPASWARAPAH